MFQEVELYAGSGVCDLVAQLDGNTVAIEGKRSLSMEVMGQALAWRDRADGVAVCVPRHCAGMWSRRRRRAGPEFARRAARALGMGILTVCNPASEYGQTGWLENPSYRDPSASRVLSDVLHDRHRDFVEAGRPNGHRLTPFQIWREAVRNYVSERPGTTAAEIAANVPDHYASRSSAASMVHRWAEDESSAGLGLVRDESSRPYTFRVVVS